MEERICEGFFKFLHPFLRLYPPPFVGMQVGSIQTQLIARGAFFSRGGYTAQLITTAISNQNTTIVFSGLPKSYKAFSSLAPHPHNLIQH